MAKIHKIDEPKRYNQFMHYSAEHAKDLVALVNRAEKEGETLYGNFYYANGEHHAWTYKTVHTHCAVPW
jgi:hypothetical protein